MRIIVSLIAISILALAVLMSGCTSGPAAGPSATPMPMDMPMGTPTPAAAVSPAPAPGDGIPAASLFDRAKFDWYRYEISGSMGMPMTHTYRYDDEAYLGQQALRANITMDMPPALLVCLDIWTAADGRTLNVHATTFRDGAPASDADLDAANYSQWEGSDLASPKFTAARLQAAGTETVTVGGRTYTATKYAGTTGSQSYTYWVSQDVPVPVKMLVGDAKGDTTYALAGWG